MEQKIICIDVILTRNGVKCDPLSIENCAPAQLNSILSLCQSGDVLTIEFNEKIVNAQGMPVKD